MGRLPPLSGRTTLIRPSGIRRLFDLAQKTPGVISLGIGEPDFDTPSHIKEAAKKALDEGYTHYTPNPGFPDLRRAIAKKLKAENHIDVDEEEVVVTDGGGTGALSLAILALVNPGDEVIIPNPGFVVYEAAVIIAGGKPVYATVREEDQFRLMPEEVARRVTSKTKCLIINTPNNPTGSILTRSDLEGIAKVAVEHNLYIISDEVYEKLVYDGEKHYSIASLEGMKERTVTVNSFSKTYAMTGWRIGYLAADRMIIEQIIKLQQFTQVHAPAISQRAALTALEGPQDFVKMMVTEYDKRRKLTVKRLNEIKGFSCMNPKGAFYAFPNVKGLGKRSEEVAEVLFKEGGIVTVPGTAFGPMGEGYLRISYAVPINKLEEAYNRIEKVVNKLRMEA
ncbi:MAG: pyridoxal phosphate-dependent aminotransferase [Candidatus Nezhaarchaeales archaeon]